jgi:hypothetical protein
MLSAAITELLSDIFGFTRDLRIDRCLVLVATSEIVESVSLGMIIPESGKHHPHSVQ